jgi:TPR repeat protein
MTTFLLLIIVLLLLAILCRIDPGIKRWTARVVRTCRIALFCTAALISGIILWFALVPRWATFYKALEAGQSLTWWITGGLFIVTNFLFGKLADYTSKHEKVNTFVIVAWFLCFCTFAGVCGSVIIGWLKERSKTDPDLGWKFFGVIGGFVVLRVLLDLALKEIGRYRACHSKERTPASFMRRCSCRQRCRDNCAACSVCNTYHHSTLDHPGPPTEELDVCVRELSDAEAEWVAEWARCQQPELLKGIDVPEGQESAVTRGRMFAQRYGGVAARGLGTCYHGRYGCDVADPDEVIRWWRIGVERGDLLSAIYLGYEYEIGSRVPKDPVRALRWYLYAGDRAIEKNDSATMHALGAQYEHYRFTRSDYKEALKWYGLAAECGDIRSMVRVAKAYSLGEGLEHNLTEAAEWYKRAAENDNNEAKAQIARCYEEGVGVPQDYTQALFWIKRSDGDWSESIERLTAKMTPDQKAATEQGTINWLRLATLRGDPAARRALLERPETRDENLRWLAEQGDLNAQRELFRHLEVEDPVEAAKWCEKMAAQGDPESARWLGRFYQVGRRVAQDFLEAAKWYRVGIEKGDGLSTVWLGSMYTRGDGVPRDTDEALRLFHQAGERAIAEDSSLVMYELGKEYGALSDFKESFRWYAQAAERNAAYSMVELGGLYEKGLGVGKDFAKAAEWYKKAAEQGDDMGKALLGRCYAEGQGVPKDSVQAYAWFQRSRFRRKFYPLTFAEEMTPEQIAEAKRLAAEWNPTWESVFEERFKTVDVAEKAVSRFPPNVSDISPA